MLTLTAKTRKEFGKKAKHLRGQGMLPAILYGPGIKNLPLEISLKEFKEIYQETGKSSLLSLKVKEKEKEKEFTVLIHKLERDPVTLEPIHVDFYQPNLKEEVEATVPLVFVGESKAVKDLKGTLVQTISEVEVKALPLDLPKEIEVNIESLQTFDDVIKIKDLKVSPNVKILKDSEEIVAQVLPPEKVEEELAKPIEEKVEEVEKVEEKEEKETEAPKEEAKE